MYYEFATRYYNYVYSNSKVAWYDNCAFCDKSTKFGTEVEK